MELIFYGEQDGGIWKNIFLVHFLHKGYSRKSLSGKVTFYTHTKSFQEDLYPTGHKSICILRGWQDDCIKLFLRPDSLNLFAMNCTTFLFHKLICTWTSYLLCLGKKFSTNRYRLLANQCKHEYTVYTIQAVGHKKNRILW